MGIIHDFMVKRKISKLEDEIAANPQPALFVALYNIYISEGKVEEANRTIHRGAALFPDSELKKTEEEARKVELEMERERLEDKIRNYPNPILYAKLAEVYLKSDEPDKSLKICQTGIQHYPKYGGTYLVIADICIYKGDNNGAIENFERALSLDRYNYTALRKLADLHMKNNDIPRAIKALEDILYFAPEDKPVQEELKKAKQMAQPDFERANTMAFIRKDALKHPVNFDNMKPAGTSAQAPAVAEPKERPVPAAKSGTPLSKLKEVSGVNEAIMVDSNGLVVDSFLKENSDEELVAALITTLYRTNSEYSNQLAIGKFEEFLISCEKEEINIYSGGDLILAVWADPSVKKGLLEMKIHDVLDIFLESR